MKVNLFFMKLLYQKTNYKTPLNSLNHSNSYSFVSFIDKKRDANSLKNDQWHPL